MFQPEWSPAGVLHFVSDRSGWWNLYRWRDGQRGAEALAPMQVEFGVPAWTLGSRTYAFESAARIVCQYCEQGRWRLAVLDTRSKRLTPVETPYTESARGDIRAARGRVVMEAAAPDLSSCLVSLDPDLDGGAAARSSHATDEDEDRRPGSAGQPAVSARVTRLRQSQEVTVGDGYLSAPPAIAFETTGGETAHAIYYPPCNPDFAGPSEARPPLLVKSHGGPTSAASTALSLGLPDHPAAGAGGSHRAAESGRDDGRRPAPQGAAGRLPAVSRRAARLPQGRHARRALEAELYFYSRILGFTPADDIEPVAIDQPLTPRGDGGLRATLFGGGLQAVERCADEGRHPRCRARAVEVAGPGVEIVAEGRVCVRIPAIQQAAVAPQ